MHKIIITEDETITRLNIKSILEDNGYNVIGEADNADEVIALCESVNPDVILMDIVLKGEKDGVTAAEEIKNRFGISVIFISAYSDSTTIKRAKAVEPSAYIFKPINERELLAVIEITLFKNKIEQKLKNSEKKYRDLYDNAPDMFVTIDPETGLIIECNRTFQKCVQETKDELIGLSLFDFFHPECRDDVNEIFIELLEIGSVHDRELKIVYGDSKTLDVSLNASAVTDFEGNILLCRTVMRDISLRKETEKKLVETEKRYQALFERSTSLVYLHDVEGNMVDANETTLKLLGYTRDEILQLKILDIVSTEDRDKALEQSQVLKDEGRHDFMEFKLRKKDGSHIFVENQAIVIYKDGKPDLIQGIANDITYRKMTEYERSHLMSRLENRTEELHKSRERFIRVIEENADAFLILDENQSVIFANSAAEKLIGRSIGELIGEKMPYKVEPGTRKEIQTGQVTLTGDSVYIEVVTSETEIDKVKFFIISMRDITMLKRLNTELAEISIRDELTGILNRRGFFTLSEERLTDAKRDQVNVAIIFADLDGLKDINDKLGHFEGDNAIVEFSDILKKVFDDSVIVARIGGDEFAMMLYDTSREEGEKKVAMLKNAVVDINKEPHRNFKLSASVGLTAGVPGIDTTIDDLIHSADELMYKEKRARRIQRTS